MKTVLVLLGLHMAVPDDRISLETVRGEMTVFLN